MPLQLEDGTTPAGHPCLIAKASGYVTLAEAQAMGPLLEKGARYHQQRVLSPVAKGTEYSPEARKYFPNLNPNLFALAAVVTSPLVRAAINLMLRFTGKGVRFRMFTTEAEAMAWLDSVDP